MPSSSSLERAFSLIASGNESSPPASSLLYLEASVILGNLAGREEDGATGELLARQAAEYLCRAEEEAGVVDRLRASLLSPPSLPLLPPPPSSLPPPSSSPSLAPPSAPGTLEERLAKLKSSPSLDERPPPETAAIEARMAALGCGYRGEGSSSGAARAGPHVNAAETVEELMARAVDEAALDGQVFEAEGGGGEEEEEGGEGGSEGGIEESVCEAMPGLADSLATFSALEETSDPETAAPPNDLDPASLAAIAEANRLLVKAAGTGGGEDLRSLLKRAGEIIKGIKVK